MALRGRRNAMRASHSATMPAASTSAKRPRIPIHFERGSASKRPSRKVASTAGRSKTTAAASTSCAYCARALCQFRQDPRPESRRLFRHRALRFDQRLKVTHQNLAPILVLQGLDEFFEGFGSSGDRRRRRLRHRRRRHRENQYNYQ